MREFAQNLTMVDDDELADVAADVAREQRKRLPQKDPGSMSAAEFAAWSVQQISSAEKARADELADEAVAKGSSR